MWQNKLNGILGLWVIALAFLGFSVSMHRALLVLTGLIIAVIAFLGKVIVRPPEKLAQLSEQQPEPQAKEPVSDIRPNENF